MVCADLPAEMAAPMAVSQWPLSAAALTEKGTVADWNNLPAWYLLSAQVSAIPPDCQGSWPGGWTPTPSQ
jgi:hypothetical protein